MSEQSKRNAQADSQMAQGTGNPDGKESQSQPKTRKEAKGDAILAMVLAAIFFIPTVVLSLLYWRMVVLAGRLTLWYVSIPFGILVLGSPFLSVMLIRHAIKLSALARTLPETAPEEESSDMAQDPDSKGDSKQAPKTRQEAVRQATSNMMGGIMLLVLCAGAFMFMVNSGLLGLLPLSIPVCTVMLLFAGLAVYMIASVAPKLRTLAKTLPDEPEEPARETASSILKAVRCPSCTGTIPSGVELCPYCESPRELSPV